MSEPCAELVELRVENEYAYRQLRETRQRLAVLERLREAVKTYRDNSFPVMSWHPVADALRACEPKAADAPVCTRCGKHEAVSLGLCQACIEAEHLSAPAAQRVVLCDKCHHAVEFWAIGASHIGCGGTVREYAPVEEKR